MTAEENECSVTCEGSKAEFDGEGVLRLDSDGDLKGSGDRSGIAHCEGEEKDGDAMNDSFVMVNHDSGNTVEGDLDCEEKLDLVTELAVGEKPNAGSAMNGLIVGEVSQGKEESLELMLENGHDHDEDVVSTMNSEGKAAIDMIDQQTEPEMDSGIGEDENLCLEKRVNEELCEKGDSKESCVNSKNNRKCTKESGELCEEKGNEEFLREELERELGLENCNGHLVVIDAKIESTIEVGKEEPQTVVMETDHKEELASAVEVEEKQKDEAEVTEANHESEFDSSVEGEEKQDLETVVPVTDHQEESESAVIAKQEFQAAVSETMQQAEIESAVKVEEEHHPHTEITEVDDQEELKVVNVEGKKEIEIVISDDNYYKEFESVEVGEKHVAQTEITEINHRVEPESDSVVHLEENQEITIEVRETNGHEEFQSVVEVEGKQKQGMVVKETDGLAGLKSAVEVELKQEPENVVTEIEVVEAVEKQETETVLGDNKVTEPEERGDFRMVVAETMPVESLPIENELAGTSNGADDVETDESSDQLRMVPKVNCEATLEIGDGSESPKSDGEANSRCHVNDMLSTVEVSGDILENGEIMTTNHVKMQLECEDRTGPLESYNSSRLCHADEKEMVNEDACSVDDQSVGLEFSRASNDTKLQDDACKGIADSDKDVTSDCVGKNELESELNDGECMTSCVEGVRSTNEDDHEDPAHGEVEASNEIQTPPEEPSVSALDGEKLEIYAVKSQPCFMIRIPKFSDYELNTKLQHAILQFGEKIRSRNSVRPAVQMKKATIKEYHEKFEAARAAHRAARAAITAKRQEINSIQSMINQIKNQIKNASSIDDIGEKIHHIEHILQHETISLPQEKQYIREIKQLRHLREQLSYNMGPQTDIQEAFDQRDQIEERLKTLKNELESLKIDVVRAEDNVKGAWKKYDDEMRHLKDLEKQFRIADDLCQEAYGQRQNLIKESTEKSKYFLMYKADQEAASNHLFSGDRERLQSHCSEQVERVMELWNNNEEFRKQYVESNMNSTLRRLKTMDGRSLGLDEEPPILRSNVGRSSTNGPLEVKDAKKGHRVGTPVPAPEQVVPPTNQTSKSMKSSTSRGDVEDAVSSNKEADEEVMRTKEEEEVVRKAEELSRKEEELRKEKAAAELKERCRLEQRAKAKEAEERKRRKAEKAQAKADYRAQKEAEHSEKKRAKKVKKKAMLADETNGGVDGDSCDPIVDMVPTPEKTTVTTASRRSSRPLAAVKQYNTKTQPLPLPLRSRGKRKMQAWMWSLLVILLVVLLFLVLNYVSSSPFTLPNFGL